MRNGSNHTAIQDLLVRNDVLSVPDFMSACPGLPAQTVYSKIRALTRQGKLSPIGKGRYLSVHKPVYLPVITTWMWEIGSLLINKCEGIGHCITQRDKNLFIYAAKSDLPKIQVALEEEHQKVIGEKEFRHFTAELEGFIILAKLVSDSPMILEAGLAVPSLEKELVDRICDKRRASNLLSIQKTIEVYPVNVNRLNRYAARRGATEKVSAVLMGIDQDRVRMINQLQRFLATIPVTKAWVFGSYARGEETPESDLDLLVDYDSSASLSLLDTIRFKLDLEKELGKEVDLIQNGYLKPFAAASAEHDKYLVYER